MESPPLIPAALWLPAAGPRLAAAGPVLPAVALDIAAAWVRRALPIPRSQHDLELVELIPLGIGPLPLGNGKKRLQAGARGRWLRFVHGGIISRPALPLSRPHGTFRLLPYG